MEKASKDRKPKQAPIMLDAAKSELLLVMLDVLLRNTGIGISELKLKMYKDAQAARRKMGLPPYVPKSIGTVARAGLPAPPPQGA